MRRFDDVVLRFAPVRVPRQAVLLPQGGKVLSAGHQLVHIGLMPGIKNDGVRRGIKNPMNT